MIKNLENDLFDILFYFLRRRTLLRQQLKYKNTKIKEDFKFFVLKHCILNLKIQIRIQNILEMLCPYLDIYR